MVKKIISFADSYLDSQDVRYYPTIGYSDHGSDITMTVGKSGQGFIRRGVIAFDLSSVPDVRQIRSVKMVLYNTYPWASMNVYAYRLTRSNWTESGVCWVRYDSSHSWTNWGGDYTTTNGAVCYIAGEAWYTWDITALAKDSFSAFSKQVHVLLWGDTGPAAYPRSFRTRDYTGAEKPYLLVTTDDGAMFLLNHKK